MQKHDQDYIRRKNRSTVFELIRKHSPLSRAEIARLTGMSPTTVSRIVSELYQQDFMHEIEQTTTGVGRKAVMLHVNPGSVLSVGVEIDRGGIRIGIVDLDGKVVHSTQVTRDSRETPEATLERIASAIEELIQAEDIDRRKVVGIGVGLPGIVDYAGGSVVLSAQLGWKQTDIAGELRRLTGFEVAVDNELKVRALAEHQYGSARGSSRSVLIGFGSGVGSSLIIDGEIYRGETNSAGEIGHTVVDPGGLLCECGKVGCLQTYIAEASLVEQANKIKPIGSLEELFQARKDGEYWAASIVDRAMTFVAVTVSNIACVYNPDTVILTGKLVESFPEVRDFISDKCMDQFVWEPLRGTFQIVYSSLESDGVVIGSGILAQNLFLDIDRQMEQAD
ncbi:MULTISPECIES: ROK family transcriptional regulator [unclassified Paenibacillus]|uniref:ROK family transcriptional regulator n=1 Tax=unclassified Paenibacillus TaxID=185978 RepID=UPI000CF8C563|nr:MULTISPECIES: ROK family transcriptional regulator [unclassified Paenibacillus]MBJ9988768.1 ROK family transcriptional regulator [Paenibacillus sp. S28]PQP91360.1 sugar kinase [Paenibacillus sp. AR247]